MSSCNKTDILGASPANVKWNVVRGDTSKLRVEFFDDDEVTAWDLSDWTFVASAYDNRTDIVDELSVVLDEDNKFLDIVASADITNLWGDGYRSPTSELFFDLQVTLDDGTIWTPVIGTIAVIADISGGL
jgi:hypothetical protein